MEYALIGGFFVLFFSVAALIVGILVYNVVRAAKHGGIKNTLFGGRIVHTYGEIVLPKRGVITSTVKVHRVERATGPAIGIETVHVTPLSYQVTPLTLEPQDAARLAQILDQALRSR